jgi:1-acyl-sn-glycerol-3-phosphate acyltransferase
VTDAPVAAGDRPWARRAPARALRGLILSGVFRPLVAGYARVRVSGLEGLSDLSGPVVFVANHSSHVDTPILLNALSAQRRGRTLMAAAADYFYVRRSLAVTVSLAFGTVPVRRHPGDGSSALQPLERLVAGGWSLVLYAEGTRSRSGRLGRLRPGAAALAARRSVPLVPVHIAGTSALMPPGRGWMVRPADGSRRHAVTVCFGTPLHPGPGEDPAVAMESVRAFMAARGGDLTAPAPERRAPAPIA